MGMDHQTAERRIIALGSWLNSPAGAYVRAWEQARLDALVADIFGFNAVQIGLPEVHGLATNRMPCQWLTDTQLPEKQAGQPGGKRVVVVHDFAELPFATQSLD